MLAGKELERLLKFMKSEKWLASYKQVLHDHLGDDRETAMASEWSMFIWVCAIDDFLTTEFWPGKRNPIDDYLKRRGYTVSATAKSYLQGLRTTVMSVYEVTSVSTASFTVRDVIRDDVETTIAKTAITRDLRKRDRIATRIVPVRGGNVLANGTLPFPGRMNEMLMAVLQDTSVEGGDETQPTITEMLRANAHVFSIVLLCNGFAARPDPNCQGGQHKSPFALPVGALRSDPVGSLFN